MRKKIESYLGFAARSRNLVTGYNTCIMAMQKRKLKLLILASDLSENSIEKLVKEAEKTSTSYKIYGSVEGLSHITGNDNKGVFGVTDRNFADIISQEIDKEQSLNQEVF